MPPELYPHLVEADLLVVAPLSANTLAKLAHGLADNVPTQTALAFQGPMLVAPAMNVRMWEHRPHSRPSGPSMPAASTGSSEAGELAEGESGRRMSEPEKIFARCSELVEKAGSMRGRRILVSAGARANARRVRFLETAHRAAWASRWRRKHGAWVRCDVAGREPAVPAPGVSTCRTPTAADRSGKRSPVPTRTVLMAVRLPTTGRRADARKAGERLADWTVELEPKSTSCASWPLGRTARWSLPSGRARRGWAGGGSGHACRQDSTSSSSTTSREPTSASTPRNEVVLISRSGERRIPKAPNGRSRGHSRRGRIPPQLDAVVMAAGRAPAPPINGAVPRSRAADRRPPGGRGPAA